MTPDPSPSVTPDPSPSPSPAPQPAPAPTHTRCGWIGGGDPVGEAAFAAHASEFNTVHPKWFGLGSDGVSIKNYQSDSPTVVNAARANHVRLMPLIDADSVDPIRALINDPQKRAQHIQNLVTLATTHGYDGIDIDYEHLWSAADRAPFTAFMTELAAAFHAHGLELSEAIPTIGVDHGDNGYDYKALASVVDTLHLMGYDFHYLGSHLGPLAPLGWIDAAMARAQATGHADHFMLGLANYAIGDGWWTTTRDALSRCTSAVVEQTNHMLTCSFDYYDAGLSPHCPTASGDLWFENLDSMDEKLTLAQKYGARGVTYWTIGDEIDGYFAMVRRHFP